METGRNSIRSLAIIGGLVASLNLVHASTNTLWLSLSGVSNGWGTLTLNGTLPGSNYTLLSESTLIASNWNTAGQVTGAQNQSWTAVQVPLTDGFARTAYEQDQAEQAQKQGAANSQ